VAISTAPGRSALGVVRVSGSLALRVRESLFAPDHSDGKVKPRVAYHGWIRDPRTFNPIDEVLVTFFPAPASYTGEDMLEISAHGSMVALRLIVEACQAVGARMAEPGEFTRRAFLNGKLTLDEAEAVADVIAARSEASLRAAQQHLRGAFARTVEELQDRLTHFLALIEASLDFPEEEIELMDEQEMVQHLRQLNERVRHILQTFDRGRLLRDGLHLVLAGPPNVGKSSLLNALLRYERALVTPIPGTTRDTVEEDCLIKGIPVKAIDTAGLRITDDPVEKLGVERARKRMAEADVIVLVLDLSEELSPESETFLLQALPDNPRKVLCLNKTDLPRKLRRKPAADHFHAVVETCALNGEGIEALETAIADTVWKGGSGLDEETLLVSRLRHKELLEAASNALEKAIDSLISHAPLDCVCIDLREAFHSLEKITGGDGTQALLDTIFSEFCIGK